MHEPLGVPRHIGRYTILRKIGQGGMGAVYEAEQENPRRTVALKVITGPAAASPETLRRFELEVQVLGMLQHPGIAHIFEAGTFEIGGELRPFFAMELVRGVPLLEWADAKKLSTRERLELLARICDALHHAHERGIVHRDLKPSNILVTDEGEPKVLDFGVARATNADVRAVTMRTDVGQLVGTLPYMSPEQASGDPTRIDSRSDVYSLGVVGYQLLSGHMPYDIDRVMLHEGVRIVREVEARPLSSVARSLRGDVETIVGKALEKDVERRYESAAEMASDIRRHLADEPIRARPPSSLYQLGKFARRNKALVGGVVAVVLALIAGLVGTSLGIVEARRSATVALEKGEEAKRSALEARAREEEATLEAARASQLAAFLQRILGGIDPAFAQGVDTTLLERILAETATRIDTELAGQPRIEFEVRTLLGTVYFSLGKYPPSIAQYERARAILAPIAGERDPRVLRTRLSIAVLKHTLGRTEESYAELVVLADEVASALGEESELYDETRGELGVVLLDKSEHDRAAELFERSLAWRRAAFGDDDEKSLIALNCLGLARAEQGRLEEAEALMSEVLERRERTNGPNHPETIKAVGNLGAFYDAHGKSADAERLARRAYEASLPVLGEEHPESLRYVLNLANALRSLHRYDEAHPLFDRALAIERRVSGPEHPETLRAEAGLALLLRNVGRALEAAELHGHVVEVKRRELGDSDPDTLMAEVDLATDWMRAGRDAEAIALLERVVPSMSKALGERDDDTLVAIHDLGAAYLGAGRAADAERVLRRALAVRMEVSGAEQHDTLICQGSLGLALQALEKDAEAIPHLAAMLVGWRRRYGDGDVAAQNAASEILRSARRVEDLGPFEAQLAPVVDHYRATNNRTQLACALVLQAESRAARAKWDECVPLLDEAVDLSTSAGGDGGPTAARAFGTLGAIKLARGKPDAAEPLLVQCWEALGEDDSVAKRRAARSLAEVHAARGDERAAGEWRERSTQ